VSALLRRSAAVLTATRRKCSSCHDLGDQWSERKCARQPHLMGRLFSLNTLTVFQFHALFSGFGWKGEFRTLEAQAAASLQNPRIMDSRNRRKWSEKLSQGLGTSSISSRWRMDMVRTPADRPGCHRDLRAIAGYGPPRPLRPLARRRHGGHSRAQQIDGYRLFQIIGMRLMPPGA